jgi:hypothetical protein
MVFVVCCTQNSSCTQCDDQHRGIRDHDETTNFTQDARN